MTSLLNRSVAWARRYYLDHVLFWVVYNGLWAFNNSSGWAAQDWVVLAGFVLGHIPASYFNIYVLVPRLLQRQRYLAYGGALLGTVLAGAAVVFGGFALAYHRDPEVWAQLRAPSFYVPVTIASTALTMLLVMSIKLIKDRLREGRRLRELEKEKLETELKFLRAQFNPHFLFNTINSIYFLIHKNPTLAAETLAKFSELLRYQLYECNEATIPLAREVGYLSNFVELEKLRQDPALRVTFEVGEGFDGQRVAPFLLMPFVENAFKHVADGADPFIDIRLRTDADRLYLTVENRADNRSRTASLPHPAAPSPTPRPAGGLGLANVRRRLDLLYPGRHRLEVTRHADVFRTELELQMD